MNETRFRALWARCSHTNDDGSTLIAELTRRYAEPHRHYHTANHIAHCLEQFDAAKQHMQDPDAVEMALWFHDIIYDPRANDNERQSARLFRSLVAARVDTRFADNVVALIMLTTHQECPSAGDGQLMVDIDLSSFGMPWERFIRDGQAIREEFAHLSDAEFLPQQRAFLQSLLDRPHLYASRFFRDRYESTARENISRLLNAA